jgi:hypothetical protein
VAAPRPPRQRPAPRTVFRASIALTVSMPMAALGPSPRRIYEPEYIACHQRSVRRSDALAQPEKRQDREYDDNEADEVDNTIHTYLLSRGFPDEPKVSAAVARGAQTGSTTTSRAATMTLTVAVSNLLSLFHYRAGMASMRCNGERAPGARHDPINMRAQRSLTRGCRVAPCWTHRPHPQDGVSRHGRGRDMPGGSAQIRPASPYTPDAGVG